MNALPYYDLFIHIVSMGIDFNDVFSSIDEDIKLEILNYVEFLKKKPSKKEFISYEISNRSLTLFKDAVYKIIRLI